MEFNSWFFFLTLLPFLAGYFWLRTISYFATRVLVLIYSLFFYGMWNPAFLLLLMGSTVIDYAMALGIERWPQWRGRLLMVSLVTNLGMLGFFKYFNLFAASATWLAQVLGQDILAVPKLDILLPVGISFYTFQTLSYTIDVYLGTLKARKSLLDVAFFVTYFPQLVAGPIVRADQFLPQIEDEPKPTAAGISSGITLIVLGLFMKCVLADNAAPRVAALFDTWQHNGLLENWAAAMLFGVQIHGDFSGYSLIGIGMAMVMGYYIPRNFKSPYGALGFSDFWNRWHISLSTWLRDYLYIPLGGNRGSSTRTYVNLMVTMLLGGLWHGASIMFVIWGGLHGLYLCFQRPFRGALDGVRSVAARRILVSAGIVLTYLTVSITWIPFRAQSSAQCFAMLGGMFVAPFRVYAHAWLDFGLIGCVFAGHVLTRNMDVPDALDRRPVLRTVLLALLLVALYYFSGESNEFIYFQF